MRFVPILTLALALPVLAQADPPKPKPIPVPKLKPARDAKGMADLDKLRASVVQIFVVSQDEDYYRPWQRPRPSRSSGSGAFIGNKRILTNAHVISNAKNLLVKRADLTKRYKARVVHAGHDCDLAIVTVDDAEFWKGMEALVIGARPELRSTVATVGYPMGGNRLSITEGVVSRIELQTYVHSRADQHLAIQIDAAINPGNSGGPVVQNGEIAGIAFQGQFFSQSIGYMIPPSVIHHFLEDTSDGKYDGYPELGLYTSELENDALRKFLRVPEGESGVVILKAMPYASAVGHVKRNDVLVKIDGNAIQNDGTVKIGEEFLDYSFIVEGKHVGDTVTLTVRRAGKLVDVPVKLKAWDARMSPAIDYDMRPQYMVSGGYVFVPLTTNYLRAAGRNEELTFVMQQYYRTVAKEGKTREQLVILSRVLPHASTRYRSYRNAIVAKVNGKEPNDFREFVSLIDRGEGDRILIEFEGVNVAPLVLSRAKLKLAHEEINKRYGILEDRHVEEEG
ncbi:MAG: S1C family serine protease [Planctomycetota bacterium]|jgi:S1-C subfamily serine protease